MVEVTDDLIGNKIEDRIKRSLKTVQQNSK